VKRHLLVIDDDEDILDLAMASLELQEGWSVSLASSGERGLVLAKEKSPDAILLDVMMPGLDGPATFKALRDDQATQQIPIILLTANARQDERYLLELQLSGVVTKPFDPYGLANDVKRILQWA
jgi:DNA-binding response OmpR family regulator